MLREATIDDLDYLTDIQVLAFPSDPQWDYRFPHRKKISWRYKEIYEIEVRVVPEEQSLSCRTCRNL